MSLMFQSEPADAPHDHNDTTNVNAQVFIYPEAAGPQAMIDASRDLGLVQYFVVGPNWVATMLRQDVDLPYFSRKLVGLGGVVTG